MLTVRSFSICSMMNSSVLASMYCPSPRASRYPFAMFSTPQTANAARTSRTSFDMEIPCSRLPMIMDVVIIPTIGTKT